MNHTEEITVFINAIRELSGIGICYYDLNSFFNYDKYGTKNNRGHYCGFCERARSLPGGKANCERSDRLEAVELARQYEAPFFYECHMGMRELIIPLIRDHTLLGILFVGQCRREGDYSTEIKSKAQRVKGDAEEFLNLYMRLPKISQKDMLNIGKLLLNYFDEKILNRDLLSPKATANTATRDLSEAMHSFIRQNYRYELSTKIIADEFHVNASYASRCFSQKYGITVTEYITRVRIERAKLLLSATEAPIGNIALNVGFDDVNYFSRVFKKQVGCSPVQYRKNR